MSILNKMGLVLLYFLGIFSIIASGGGGESETSTGTGSNPVELCSAVPPSAASSEINSEYVSYLDTLAGNNEQFNVREGLLSPTYSIGSFLNSGTELQTVDNVTVVTDTLGSQVFNNEFVYSSSSNHESSLGVISQFSLGLQYAEQTSYQGVVKYKFEVLDATLRRVQNPGLVVDENIGVASASDSFVYGVYEATISNTITLDSACNFEIGAEVSLLTEIINASAGSNSQVNRVNSTQLEIISTVPVPIAYLIDPLDLPPQRLNVTASVEQGPQIILDWDTLAGINNYRVLFSRNSGFSQGDEGVQESTAIGQSATITENFIQGERVYFRVYPTVGGNLVNTSEGQLAVKIPETVPQDIIGISDADVTEDGIEINWTLPQNNDANEYRIHRGKAPDYNRTLLKSIKRSEDRDAFRKRKYVDSSIEPSTSYRYWIQYGNYNSPPFSDFSAAVTVISGEEVNVSPTANAGDDQSVSSGSTVFLDGSSSFDPDSEELSYAWTQVNTNNTVILSNANTERTSFIAPVVESEIVLTFRLVVDDGNSNDTDEVNITVTPPDTTNLPPIASIYATPSTVVEGNAVTLDATASSDPEGASLSYQWSQIDETGLNVNIDNSTTPVVSFVAPAVEEQTMLTFRLDVNDNVHISSATVSVTVNNEVASNSDLVIEMVVNPNPVRANESLRVELFITNKASFDKSDVKVVMPFPADSLYDLDEDLISSGGNCIGGGSSIECDVSGDRIEWDFTQIKAHSTKRLDFFPFVKSDIENGDIIEFTAQVFESEQEKDNVNKSLPVVSSKPLKLTLSPDNTKVLPNEEIIFEIFYGNTFSNIAIENLTVEVVLPANMTVLDVSNSANVDNGKVSWSFDHLNPGEVGKQVLTILPQQSISVGTQLEFVASMKSQQNNQYIARTSSVVSVEPSRELELSLEVGTNPVKSGEYLPIELVINNKSSFERSNIQVQMRYPALDLEDIDEDVISDGGNCVGSGSSIECDVVGDWVVWNIDSIAAKSTARVNFIPLVKSNRSSGVLFELVPEVIEGGDIVSEARKTIPIIRDRKLELGIVSSLDPVKIEESFNYEITYGHSDQSNITNDVVLEVELAPQLQISSATGQNEIDGSNIRWVFGDLVPGQIGKQQVSVLLKADTDIGSQMQTLASIKGSSSNIIESSAESINSVLAERPISLDFTITPDPVVAGSSLDVRLTINNNSSFTRSNLAIHLRYPAQFLRDLNESLISDGGDCRGNGSSIECDVVGDWIVWNIGSLGANSSKVVNFSPVVFSTIKPGSLIPFQAEVEENNVWKVQSKQSVRVQGQE